MKNKRILLWVLPILVVLLTAAVVICVFLPDHDGGEEEINFFEQYYNNKCQSYSLQNYNAAKGQIVFVGDSITDLYVLDDHYADLDIACYNRGIGGDTTQGVLDRLQVSIFDIQPAVVVLMIGTNDINGGAETEAILQRYEKIMDEIFAALPKVKLYCMSVIPQNDDLEGYSAVRIADTTPRILAVNAGIQRLAQNKGVIYLDIFSLLADEEDHLIKAYSDDGLHLNVEGLRVWTALLKPYLAQDILQIK